MKQVKWLKTELDKYESTITNHLNNDWLLYGSVSVSVNEKEDKVYCYQMLKKEEDDTSRAR